MKSELYNRSSVIDLDLTNRIHRLNSKDTEFILMIITYYLEEIGRSNVYEINIANLVNLIDEKLIVIENREE